MILRKNEIKHYSGLESELITTLPSGDTFFCTDTNNLYKYNEDKLPHLIGDGPQGPIGPQGPQGESGVGANNTGAPFLMVGQRDLTTSYTDSNGVIYLSWTGGSGTFHLELPLASEEPYRIIRIINDGTLSAQDKVHVTCKVGDSIDGGDEYVLNKAFHGVQIWSDGNNWIVIQAKAN